MQFDFITASIVVIPAAYATLVAFKFISGLVQLWNRPIAVDEPQTHTEESEPVAPAFIPNEDGWVIPDDGEAALVDTAALAITHYWLTVPTDNVVQFIRPLRATQKRQEAHPTLEGMTLRAMRELGATLKIKGARRWNTQQAIEALTAHYRAAA